MNKFKRHFIDHPYGQLHLRMLSPEKPTKCPLICLHMFPQSSRGYVNLLNSMGNERIVVAPDFPGYGESDPPPHEIDATAYADAIWHVVDTLDLIKDHGSIDLFGIHAGAKLATEVAALRPENVRKIILASAAVLDQCEIEDLKGAFLPVPLDDKGTRFRNLWDIFIRNRGPLQSYQDMAAGFTDILRGGENYEWGHHAVYEFNLRFPDVLKTLPHPIALLNPKDDLYEMTPRTLPFLQNGTMYDLPDWGQGFLECNAQELASTIQKLLNEN